MDVAHDGCCDITVSLGWWMWLDGGLVDVMLLLLLLLVAVVRRLTLGSL